MKRYREVIKKPMMTEKSLRLAKERNEYTFEVAKNASKGAIKEVVEGMFDVSVLVVRTVGLAAKPKRVLGISRLFRTSPRKKAIVKLKEGDKIEGFEAE